MTVVGIPLDRGDRGGSNDTKNMCGVAVLAGWQTREDEGGKFLKINSGDTAGGKEGHIVGGSGCMTVNSVSLERGD
jgi:hypothetical protein